MNESDRASSPRSPGPHNVAALTSIYGGSPQKKSKPPLSPMIQVDRTLAENRKGGFSSPPARKPKVFKNPVRAAPVESSDDSDSDDDAPKVKPPKPGSFEDSFNKLMASSSSYDEVESDSESESDDDSAAKNDKSKGEKVRSTPVKSTSNDPNAYSSSERGVSTSDDDDDDDDSSSSSESSDSEDSVSSEGSNASSDSSSTSSDDGTSKHGGIQSQSERDDDDDVASKTTAATSVEHGNRDLVDSGYESREENLKSEDESSKIVSDARSTPDNNTSSAPSQFNCDPVALGDDEDDDGVLKNRKHQESEEEEEDSPEATDTQSGDDDLDEVTESHTEDEDTDGAVVFKTREAPTQGQIDAPSTPRGMLASESEDTHPEDEEEHLVSASEEESILPPGSIDGMENLEVYVDSDTENEEKSRLSHDTPFVKNGLPHDPSASQDLEGAGLQGNEHRAIQVDGTEKAAPVDETEVEDSEEERRPRADPEQPLTAKALDKDDHDEEVGSRGDSELSEDMDDEDEEDEKKTRRRRCMLILCCLACIVLLAIAYIFVWIFVIHKKSNGSKPADVKQLVGELYGAVAMYQLGSAVAVSGDGLTIASGAPGYQGTSGTSVGVGQVRVMSRQGPTLSEWAQIGQLLQGDNDNDAFGSSVSLSGNGAMLAIGAAKRDGLGYVRVFNLTASNQWQQASSDIVANQSFSGFGVSLAVSANGLVVAVGAPNYRDGNTTIRTGEVRVYGLFDQAWRLLGEPLVGQADGDGFGSSVSLSADGRIMAVGSPGNSLVANATGLVQAFMYNIPGNFWQQMGSNIKGDQEFDRLGVSVSVSSDGKTLATGMVTNDARGGMVRAYRLGSDSAWSQIGNGAVGEQPYSQWGYSVALSSDGSRVVAGAPLESTINGQQSGRVRVFEVETWKEIGIGLSGKSQGDNFGQSVSISGDGRIILAGAPNFTNTFYRPNGAQELPGAGYAQVYEIP